jgi:hypothetical protein
MDEKVGRRDKRYPDQELRNIDDTYVFDSVSGLYKPKTEEGQTQRSANERAPLDVSVRRDRVAIVIAIATFAVVALYTFYARQQWKESVSQTDMLDIGQKHTRRDAARSIDQLKASNDIAVANNRPWIATVPAGEGALQVVATRDDVGKYVDFGYLWQLKNAGHRPARIEQVLTTGGIYTNTCGTSPSFNKTFPGRPTEFKSSRSSTALLLPDSTTRSPFAAPITEADWKQVVSNKKVWCIYISLEYRDLDYPQVLHHTRECRIFFPPLQEVAACNSAYSFED